MSNPSFLPAAWRHLRAALALALPLAVAAPAGAAVMISQVYGGGGNAGAPYTNDFVELHNSGTVAVSVTGWTLQYASAAGTSWTNNTTLSGSIPAGGYLLVRQAGGTVGSALPAADVTGTINMSATAGKLALVSNSTVIAAGVSCPIPSATVVDFVGYGSTANCAETAPAPAPSNTTALLRASLGNSCLDSGNNSTDFSATTPLPRNSMAPAQPCGGTGGGGGGGGTPVAAAIYTIQGSGATSPLVGQAVTTSGVVTNVLNNGFFIQDLNGDGNPATSDGVFVFTSSAPPAAAAVGNLVQVTGTVVEFASGAGTAATPLTEIGTVTAVNLLGTGYTVAPTPVALPLAAGDTLERFEGMLVRITTALTVQQNFFQARYGQLTLGAGGRHETPTNRYRPGTPQALALADLQARSRVLLDDNSSLQNTNPTAFFYAGGVPRAGDTVGPITGTIDFGLATATASGAGLYRIQPTVAPVFSITNPRMAAPPAVGGNVRLASMNVLNFFTTFTDGTTASGQAGQGCTLGTSTSAGNCRGADNLAEFNRQRAKIVQALAGLNADAVGLMEIQNNGNVAAQNLVDALNAVVGAGTYAPVAVPPAGTGTDAIRVAMIYKTARFTPVGAPLSDPDAVNNRPPLAQTFMAANGEKVTLVVNHLKSKGGCPSPGDADAAGNLDAGDGQGCWNAQRRQQAQRLRTFVAQVQAASGSNDVMLVGDFNAYAQEDPIYDLTSNGYVDQLLAFNSFEYSYVFDGTAGYLDHAITTASMAPKVASVVHWHIDADESLAYDYNLEFKQPACPTCAPDPFEGSTPYRASDHDPVLLGFNLYKTITSAPVTARTGIVGTAGDDIIVGGPGANVLTGNGGSNIFAYTSMRDAGDTITDFAPGKDRLDLRTLLAGIGWNGVNPVAEGYVRFSAGRTGTVVEVDTDGPAGAGAFRVLATLTNVTTASMDAVRDLIVR